MPCNTQTWDELFVPFYHDDLTPITINWEQWFSDRSAHYYAVSVDNLTQGQKATLFIAAEWYEEDMKNNTEHLSKIVHEEVHDGYKVLVDGRFQYGQISSDVGGGRFLVYHDKDRKPFQRRFLQYLYAEMSDISLSPSSVSSTSSSPPPSSSSPKRERGRHLQDF